jgi:phosphoserine phosphatase
LPVARQLAHALNCRGVHANELGAKDGKLSGDLDGIIVDATSKAEFTRANRAAKGNVAVGDGANDIPMLQAVEWAIGMEPKPLVRPVVEGILDDFRGLTLVFKQIQ